MAITAGTQSTIANVDNPSFVSLSATKGALVYVQQNVDTNWYIHGRVVNTSGNSIDTVGAEFDGQSDSLTTTEDEILSVSKISSTKFLVGYLDDSARTRVATFTISADVISMDASLDLGGVTAQSNCAAVAHSTTLGMAIYRNDGNLKINTFTIGSGTLTDGTEDDLATSVNALGNMMLSNIGSTTSFLSYRDATDTNKIKARHITCSNTTTYSTGAEVTMSSDNALSGTNVGMAHLGTLDSTHLIEVHTDNSNNLRATVGSLSGTTITAGTTVTVTAGIDEGGCVAALDGSNAFIAYIDNTDEGHAKKVTVSGTTITVESTVATFTTDTITAATIGKMTSTLAVAGFGASGVNTLYDSSFDLQHSSGGIPGSII